MMTRTYGWVMRLVTIINAAVFAYILFSVDPEEAGFLGLVFFYASFFLFVFGLVYLSGNFLYQRLFGGGTPYKSVQLATRQALLLSVLVSGTLLLLGMGILTWYNFFIFVVIISLLEYFFISRKGVYERRTHKT